MSRSVRFILVEIALFALVGVFCLVLHWSYSTVLVVTGALLLVARFGNATGMNSRNIGSYTMERQSIRDATDPKMRRGVRALTSDLALMAVPPLVVGITLMFLPATNS